ncbi:BCG-induced integral membrane protein [Intoshia linei]|uniref:BCG-induced integral membrane protein n=1 Tax=Intoshia linei TaxID=1819745 RepID=A0A177BAS2_9BILA|nr:BCG-induced integral membrane protein [Intoshia linei]
MKNLKVFILFCVITLTFCSKVDRGHEDRGHDDHEHQEEHEEHAHEHGDHDHHDHVDHDHNHSESSHGKDTHCQGKNGKYGKLSIGKVYLYSTISITIISLLSLCGVFLIFFRRTEFYNKVIIFMIALAIGTLLSDAILHLIPEVFGAHHHGPDNEKSTLAIHIKGLTILLGVIFLFHIEYLIKKIFQMTKEKTKTTEQKQYRWGIKPLAFVVTFGDAVHNFVDGMAIGVAFKKSAYYGLTVSLAVFFHELPHELGDFAILLENIKRKRNWLWAMIFNLISSLSAFLGMIVSISISNSPDAKDIILSFTAGLFLYLSLTDLMNEIAEQRKKHRSTIILVIQDAGFSIGVLLMYLLSYYEHDILHMFSTRCD